MKNGRSTVRSLHIAASVAQRDGGASTAVLNTVRALNELGDEALVLATTADGPRGTLTRTTRSPVLEREAPVWFCRRSWPLPLKNSWQQAIRAMREARGATVLHVHGVYLANSIWAYLASRITGTPYVLQPHGTLEPYQEAQSTGRKSVFNRLIGRRILAGATALVATSGAEAQNLQSAHPGAEVVVVPLGTARIAPEVPAVTPHRPWTALPREQRVVFLSRLARKKRPDLLLDAWNDVDAPGYLLLAGPAEDWTWEELAGTVSEDRRHTVSYLGELDEAGVAWLLQEGGLLVLPSENENFGLVVTEAMIHGCAVLTTRQTAASEHVAAARAGVVLDDLDAGTLAAAMSGLLRDPQRTQAMGVAAQEYARHHLTWQASAQRLREVYRSCSED